MQATLLFFNLVVYHLYFDVPSFFMLFLFCVHHSSVIKCIHFTFTLCRAHYRTPKNGVCPFRC